jgi:hypothetical protein
MTGIVIQIDSATYSVHREPCLNTSTIHVSTIKHKALVLQDIHNPLSIIV